MASGITWVGLMALAFLFVLVTSTIFAFGWRAVGALIGAGLILLFIFKFTTIHRVRQTETKVRVDRTMPVAEAIEIGLEEQSTAQVTPEAVDPPNPRARPSRRAVATRPATSPPRIPVSERPAIESSTGPDRPAWADHSEETVDGNYQVVISGGPFKTRAECERELDGKLEEAVQDYIQRRFGPEAVFQINLGSEEVRTLLVRKEWLEPRQSPSPAVGSMVQLHQLLVFDREATSVLEQLWRDARVAQRIRLGAAGLAGLLLLLAVAYSYLKADLATQGAYRWRLRFAALVMILGVAVAVALAVTA